MSIRLMALVGALLVATPASAQELFRSSFTGGTAEWNHIFPRARIENGVGVLRLDGGRDQQEVAFVRSLRPAHSGELLTVSARWRFPQGFSFNPGGQPWGYEHKLLIINTGNDVGRILLNLRGGGLAPKLAVHFERLEPLGQGVSKISDTQLPPDGEWHRITLELDRRSGTANRVRVWLDNTLAINEVGRVCGSPCSPITEIWFGAFSNQGAPEDQAFYLDDALVTGSPAGTPAPEPTPAPTTPDIQAARAAIARARAELNAAEQALR